MAELNFVKLPSGDCHWTIVVISQHWFRWWLGAVRQQTIAWTNVHPDLCRHMASIGRNHMKIKILCYVAFDSVLCIDIKLKRHTYSHQRAHWSSYPCTCVCFCFTWWFRPHGVLKDGSQPQYCWDENMGTLLSFLIFICIWVPLQEGCLRSLRHDHHGCQFNPRNVETLCKLNGHFDIG